MTVHDRIPVPKPEIPDDVAQTIALAQRLLDVIREVEAGGVVVSAVSNGVMVVRMPSAPVNTRAVLQVRPADPGGGRGAKPRCWEMTVTWNQGS